MNILYPDANLTSIKLCFPFFNFLLYLDLRTHARHRYNIDWFQTGKLPCLIKPKEPDEEAGSLTESMHQTHQLMADMLNVTEALDTLQHKIKILK